MKTLTKELEEGKKCETLVMQHSLEMNENDQEIDNLKKKLSIFEKHPSIFIIPVVEQVRLNCKQCDFSTINNSHLKTQDTENS